MAFGLKSRSDEDPGSLLIFVCTEMQTTRALCMFQSSKVLFSWALFRMEPFRIVTAHDTHLIAFYRGTSPHKTTT